MAITLIALSFFALSMIAVIYGFSDREDNDF